MNKFYYKKCFLYILKRQLFVYALYFVLFVLTFILSEFLFYDLSNIDRVYGSVDALSSKDYYYINMLVLDHNSVQGYIFSFSFILFILFISVIFESSMSYRRDFDVIALLRTKGINKKNSIYLFLLFRIILFALTILISMLATFLIDMIICSSLVLKIGTITLVKEVILVSIIVLAIYILINLIRAKVSYSNKKVINFMRGIY